MLSHTHHAVVVSLVSAVSRGVQDGLEIRVVGSAVDADCQTLSVVGPDSKWGATNGSTASMSGGDIMDITDRGEVERPAPVLPQSRQGGLDPVVPELVRSR